MSEITRRDALIAACRANREDKLPRLVFADYLDETGDESDAARAYQIRWQCDAGQKQRYPDEATAGCYYDVDRGFIVGVECAAAWWLQHGDDLVREHDVQRVRLTTIPDTEVIGRYGANLTARFTAYRDRQTQIGMPFPNREGVTKALLEATWPGIQFDLPPQPIPLIDRRDGRSDPIGYVTNVRTNAAGEVIADVRIGDASTETRVR